MTVRKKEELRTKEGRVEEKIERWNEGNSWWRVNEEAVKKGVRQGGREMRKEGREE